MATAYSASAIPIVVYQEDFQTDFTGGALSGQNGWSGGSQQIHTGNGVSHGNGVNDPTKHTSLYTIPSDALSVSIESAMRMRGYNGPQFGNLMGPVDSSGDALFQFGSDDNTNNFLVLDENGFEVVRTNLTDGNALISYEHFLFDVLFTVDFTGASPLGSFAVRKDGQSSFSTVASGINLGLTAEDPSSLTGLFLKSQTGSDWVDDLMVSYEPIPEPSTFVLFGVGIFGVLGLLYRQRRRKKSE